MAGSDKNKRNNFDEDMLEAGEDIFRASDIVPPFASDDDQAEDSQADRPDSRQEDVPEDISELPLEDSEIFEPCDASGGSGVIDAEFVPDISEQEREALADTDISPAQQDEQTRKDESWRPAEQNAEPEEQDTEFAGPPAESGFEEQKAESDVPSFDLADDMMAGRRKAIAARRKAPSDKKHSKNNTSQKAGQPASGKRYIAKAAPDPVIAEIVARDIEKMCRGAL